MKYKGDDILEWKKYKNYSNKESIISSKINSFSETFKIRFYTKDVLKDNIVLGYILPVSDNEEKKIKRQKILERIIKVNNLASSNQLPEIVDFKNNIVYMDYFDGVIMKDAIKNNFFVKYNSNTKKDQDEIALKRIMRSIIPSLIDFQRDLYNKNLIHLGIFPEHIIVQKDDILKIKGLRYISRHINGYIDDKVITNENLYGSIINKRYTPPELIEYIKSKGNKKIKAKTIVSYQIGILLFDIVTKGAYINNEITGDLIYNAKYYLNYFESQNVMQFILDLIDPNPVNRMEKFEDIKEKCREFTK
ncbi:protein kinase family protein [Marinitoga aeolica]|uniref:Protein kinase domain-containing protein n=1 Tax=Marinitoga aeolica TaxID=2809031 RepID=A0ABY8PRN8_9BACT|nr:hypothetical protein [Marinitoga aeolica]WGS65183.1 hypothetical protein JRV97_01100 [Marinitoga aeolica]